MHKNHNSAISHYGMNSPCMISVDVTFSWITLPCRCDGCGFENCGLECCELNHYILHVYIESIFGRERGRRRAGSRSLTASCVYKFYCVSFLSQTDG